MKEAGLVQRSRDRSDGKQNSRVEKHAQKPLKAPRKENEDLITITGLGDRTHETTSTSPNDPKDSKVSVPQMQEVGSI